MQNNRIRAIVLGLVKNGGCLLVGESYDTVKQAIYYRALGGGIEFGETSLDALKREFWEEIQVELTNIEYLCCLENVFICDGKPGHEFIQLYRCDFADPRLYQVQEVVVTEGNSRAIAYWIPIEKFKSGELCLVPEGCLDYL
jgi:8-oxo-dGTP pyrophosphatase MutT (NUDIX family)